MSESTSRQGLLFGYNNINTPSIGIKLQSHLNVGGQDIILHEKIYYINNRCDCFNKINVYPIQWIFVSKILPSMLLRKGLTYKLLSNELGLINEKMDELYQNNIINKYNCLFNIQVFFKYILLFSLFLSIFLFSFGIIKLDKISYGFIGLILFFISLFIVLLLSNIIDKKIISSQQVIIKTIQSYINTDLNLKYKENFGILWSLHMVNKNLLESPEYNEIDRELFYFITIKCINFMDKTDILETKTLKQKSNTIDNINPSTTDIQTNNNDTNTAFIPVKIPSPNASMVPSCSYNAPKTINVIINENYTDT